MWEARFIFSESKPETGVLSTGTLIASPKVSDRSDEALRCYIRRVVQNNPTFMAMTETHYISVDVGVHKDAGGLGASQPEETIVLFHPTSQPSR